MEPAIEVYRASVLAAPDDSIMALFLVDDAIVMMVMLLLVGMSVVCWAIIVQKGLLLRGAAQQSARFLDLFWRSKRFDSVYEQSGAFRNSPLAEVFKAGYQELLKVTSGARTGDAADNLTRSLRRAALVEQASMERYVAFLATTASTAPFIGLFGTVWGILRAFQSLQGMGGQPTIDVVAGDISHALVVTAMGLAAAIPAVMAYNFFNRKIRLMNIEMDNFSADFLNMVKRHL